MSGGFARTFLVTDKATCACGWRPPRQVDVVTTPELADSVALVVKLVCPTIGCRTALTLTYPPLAEQETPIGEAWGR